MSLHGSDADVCSSALLIPAILGCGRTEPPLNPLSEFAEPALLRLRITSRSSFALTSYMRWASAGADHRECPFRCYLVSAFPDRDRRGRGPAMCRIRGE